MCAKGVNNSRRARLARRVDKEEKERGEEPPPNASNCRASLRVQIIIANAIGSDGRCRRDEKSKSRSARETERRGRGTLLVKGEEGGRDGHHRDGRRREDTSGGGRPGEERYPGEERASSLSPHFSLHAIVTLSPRHNCGRRMEKAVRSAATHEIPRRGMRRDGEILLVTNGSLFKSSALTVVDDEEGENCTIVSITMENRGIAGEDPAARVWIRANAPAGWKISSSG